jgi:hypothetical protein
MGMMGLVEQHQCENDEEGREEERAHACAFAKDHGRSLANETRATGHAEQVDVVRGLSNSGELIEASGSTD